jgi:hypothetical protein
LLEAATTGDTSKVQAIAAKTMGTSTTANPGPAPKPDQVVAYGASGKVRTPDPTTGKVTTTHPTTGRTTMTPEQQIEVRNAVNFVVRTPLNQLGDAGEATIAQMSDKAADYMALVLGGGNAATPEQKTQMQAEAQAIRDRIGTELLSDFGNNLKLGVARDISQGLPGFLAQAQAAQTQGLADTMRSLNVPAPIIDATAGAMGFISNNITTPIANGLGQEFIRQVVSGEGFNLEKFAPAFLGPFSTMLAPIQSRFPFQKNADFVSALPIKTMPEKALFNEHAAAYGRRYGKPNVYLEFYNDGGQLEKTTRLAFSPLPGQERGDNPLGLPGIVMRSKMNKVSIPIVGGTPVVQMLGILTDQIELAGLFIPYKATPKEHYLWGPDEYNAKRTQSQEELWSGSPNGIK